MQYTIRMIFNDIFRKKPFKTRVLFVGHDFKFLTHVIDHFRQKKDFRVGKFGYAGHRILNTHKLKKMMPEWDVIFCEWGLDNIRWCSKNKLKNQKLIVRIHRQEFVTRYIHETNWEAVDYLIFINKLQLDQFIELFPSTRDKCHLIYNLINCKSFDLPKESNSIYNLGMLGILPMSKAPHIALGILKKLKDHDDRYRLFIKSKKPEELKWLWERPEEKAYYEQFTRNIELMNLQDSVIFEPHGDDVQDWFKKIGFILSTSEFEGSHQSIAEGMASGSIPAIRNWQGADMIYPEKYVFSDIDEAVNSILKYSNTKDILPESDSVKNYARTNFDVSVILPEYEKLINPKMERHPSFSNAYRLNSLNMSI